MKGFSLVELLTVVALLALIMAVAVPAVQSVGSAQAISQASAIVHDQLVQGRQIAVGHNRDVEIRFVNFGTASEPAYRGVQLWMQDEEGTQLNPVRKLETLPSGSQISGDASLSPLVAVVAHSGTMRYGSRNLPYKAVRIRASGSLESAVTTDKNFFTIHSVTDKNVPPQNYATLRIHPLTARITEYRP